MSAIIVKRIPTEIQNQGVDGGAPSKISNIIIARINKIESRLGYARSNTFAKTPVEFESNGSNRKLNTNPMIIKPKSDETSTLISLNPLLKNFTTSRMLIIAGKYPANRKCQQVTEMEPVYADPPHKSPTQPHPDTITKPLRIIPNAPTQTFLDHQTSKLPATRKMCIRPRPTRTERPRSQSDQIPKIA